MEVAKKQTQVIMFPFPSHGHAIPALVLAQLLVESGMHVKLVTFKDRLPHVYKSLHGLGMENNTLGFTVIALDSRVPRPDILQHTVHDTYEHIEYIIQQCLESKQDFEELVQTAVKENKNAHSCIVSDAHLGWTQDVANNTGIPRYVFYPSPASILVAMFYVKSLFTEKRLPLKNCEGDKLIEIPAFTSVKTRDMHSFLRDGVTKALHEYYVGFSLRVHESAGVLINTLHDLDGLALNALKHKRINPNSVPIFPVGPLLPKPRLNKSDKSLEWLNNQPPSSVIYISFGSIVILSADEIREIAHGLYASNQRFLWVLRPGKDLPSVDEVIPKDLRAQGLLISEWVPQQQILRHEAIGAFLTHCGWNSILESLSFGVPMVTLPSFADQAMNAKTIVDDLKVGLRLVKEGFKIDKNEVKSVTMEIMKPKSEIRERAHGLMISAKVAAEVKSPDQLEAFRLSTHV